MPMTLGRLLRTEAGPGFPPRHVLVVDDDQPSREGLGTALLHEGHSVATAADAWQAIVQLRAQPFDVAVIDLGVDLGGWDVVRIARAYQPAIAIIVQSADEDPVQSAETRAPGVIAVLRKPISLQQLTALVGGLLVPGRPRLPRSPLGQ